MSDSSPQPHEDSPEDGRQERLGLWQMWKSVTASFFGVQSSANRERDFKHGKPHHFIIIALVMTALFVFGIVAAVNFALRQAGL